MPKKKTGQRKKAEKQKLRQKEIRSRAEIRPLADVPSNAIMEVSIFLYSNTLTKEKSLFMFANIYSFFCSFKPNRKL